ncbi:helix-turn-helix domain-containing protein [Enterococcus sp. HY326]|uniref:helix-turn-helix domain-containing protein n=1 Tax=Enterococcus sp. HY326 TaxID=2971265 RepID=UPI00223EE75E|nr:helix-turn-helix domain-containing protein [Enterococcus sp. HY326]
MEIETILGSNEQDILKLVKYLKLKGGQATKRDICADLSISLKSLRSQIQLIQNNYADFIDCINLPREIHISYRSDSSFLVFQNYLYRQSTAHAIILSLLMEKDLTYTKLQKQLFLSTATINRSIRKIKEILQQNGLDLKMLTIQGPEEKVRFFFQVYLEKTYSLTENPFPMNSQVDRYLSLIVRFIKKNDSLGISTFNRHRLQRILYIAYYRSLKPNQIQEYYKQVVQLPDISEFSFFEEIAKEKASLPSSLLTSSEQELLLHFLFDLPLVMYDGQLYDKFFSLQKKYHSVSYDLFKLSRDMLFPAFQFVDTPENIKRLEYLLFSINVNALFFSTHKHISEIIGNLVNDSNHNVNDPSIEYVIDIVEQLNAFLIAQGLQAVTTNYLVDHYGFLIIESSLHSVKRVKIGLFLANDPFQTRISFDYLKNSLQFHPSFSFYNLLDEDQECDYLITNDLYFAKTNKHKYKDILVIALEKITLDTQKISYWLFDKLMNDLNQVYQV